jgi:hypothetical protein
MPEEMYHFLDSEHMMAYKFWLTNGIDIEVPDTIASHFPKDYSSVS